MSILDATTAPTLKGNIENESIPRDQAEQMLQDLINEMNDQNFDSIKYASYRTGAKLSFIMTKTNLNLVDIYNMIEAFRENNLHVLDHESDIHESRLEAVLSSIFYALNKRIPSTTDIDVERCIALVKHWLLYAYDSDANDRIRVLSVKASLSMLCSGRQVDKLRYVFSQVSEQNGKLNFTKFEAYLKEILKLPEAVGESPTFGFNEDVVNSFFRPTGPLRQDSTTLEHFLDCILASDPPPSLLWLTAFHKIIYASRTKHEVACKVCKKTSFKGLRYKCLRCVGYTLCQDCFWRGRVAGSHAVDHDSREYSTWSEGEKGTRLSAGKVTDPLPPKVPDYPEEPNPDQTMDMTNIVPSIQDYSTMNGVSHSTPSSSGKLSDPDSADSRVDDEHKLIARYAARLAESTDGPPNAKKTPAELKEDLEQNKAKRKIIIDLQATNRELLEEIRNLREVREAAADQPNGATTDPAQMEELKGLRQKKDELELRMSALQETRKELMSQLEGLMSILKAGSPRTRSTPSSPSTLPRNQDYKIRSLPKQRSGQSMHGDSKGNPSHQGRNLRSDLLHAADNVTNAMSSLVNELTSDDDDDDDDDDLNNNIRSNGMPPMISADHTSRPIPAEG
ncbi:dystrobrevin beta-like isoform X2 [Dendronephthya gigantea]|uniref:dystrobrevin beta-like isoform X2 n=1 Tax=Dendronephthya gigantea TaxID=151771 RepID=UPI00106B2080|nr:dystrobrevin beta-like isoform X2 [Dendronephthya gigantea]